MSALECKSYSDIRDSLKSFDLILFKGGDFISDFIRFLEKRKLNKTSSSGYRLSSSEFSHVGMIVKSDILNDSRLKDDKVYIWESTMSGRLGEGVTNIDGESFLGVQLRDFDKVFDKYNEPADTRIAVAHLLDECREKVMGFENTRELFTALFERLNGVRYDANPYSLFSSLISCIRCGRDEVEEMTGTEDWLFCSELVAVVYKSMGILAQSVEPKDVVPMDFLGYDSDDAKEGGISVVVKEPILLK